MKHNEKRGFTLIELLTVIIILSLIVGLVVYIAINVIDKSKEKSYQVTVNNIQKVSSEYLIENSDKLFYVTNNNKPNVEYQCVTIQDLIDNGYFKNDILNSPVSKDRKVLLTDYIYLEKDITTKNVTNIKYILSKEDIEGCSNAMKAEYDISIYAEPTITTWSKSKNITIEYKIKNYYNPDNYVFEYTYSNKNSMSVINEKVNIRNIKVTDNGTFKTYIKDKNGNVLFEKTLNINTIDNTAPVITINANGNNSYVKSINPKITINDTDSGGNPDTYKYIYSTSNTVSPNITFKSGNNYTLSDKTGIYYLIVTACDKADNCNTIISNKYYLDNTLPTITLDKESDSNKLINRDILITINETETGLKSGGVLEYGWSNSKDIEPTYQKAELNYQNGAKTTSYKISKSGLMGTHYLWIKTNISDTTNNNLNLKKAYGGYEFIYQFEVKIESTDGISKVTGSGMHIVGSQVTVTASIKDYYKFNGWSGAFASNDLSYTFTMPEHDITIKANSLKYKCSAGTLTKSGNSYICVGGNSVGVDGKECNCVTSPDCTSPYTYCTYPSYANGQCITVEICLDYTYNRTCQTCYSCKDGWKHYSGSGSGMKCNIDATT